MPERSGQLHEISAEIGELKGLLSALDRYTHEREHSITNLTQAVNGVGTLVSREVGRLKAELQVQLDAMDRRIATLEGAAAKEAGARGMALGIAQSPLTAWIFAAAVMLAAWWKGQGR
jgi:hypothetical protein